MPYSRTVIRDQWYRVDKVNGECTPVNAVNVLRAARGSFDNPHDLIVAGKFSTRYAVYARGELLDDVTVVRAGRVEWQ